MFFFFCLFLCFNCFFSTASFKMVPWVKQVDTQESSDYDADAESQGQNDELMLTIGSEEYPIFYVHEEINDEDFPNFHLINSMTPHQFNLLLLMFDTYRTACGRVIYDDEHELLTDIIFKLRDINSNKFYATSDRTKEILIKMDKWGDGDDASDSESDND